MEQSVYETEANKLFNEISSLYIIEEQSYREAANNLISKLLPEIKRYRAEKEEDNLLNSRDFNIFSFLGYKDRFSDIFADMLDPNGSHGQKGVFLSEFLDYILKTKNKNIKNRNVDVIRNIQREEDRQLYSYEVYKPIDIYMEFCDGFILVIKNTIGGGIKQNEVKDYIDYIKNKKGGKCTDFFYIYLSHRGSKPDIELIDETTRRDLERTGHFTTMSFTEDIKNWLDGCIVRCKSDRYKNFMEDMKRYYFIW